MLLKIKGMEGPVKVTMNTTALENKMSALEILRSLARDLGKSFMPYVEQVATLMATKMMHDAVASGVRKSATKMLSILIGCCDDQTKMLQLLKVFLPEFAKEILQKTERYDFMSVKWLT